MKRFFLFIASMVVMCSVTAQAAVTVRISTSDIDPLAGSELDVVLGDSSQMFVWMSTEAALTLRGISLSIVSSDPSVLQATSHTIANPAGRWFNMLPGALGDLVNNSIAAGIVGISTGAESNFTLFSTVQFTATDLGSTNINFQLGSQGFSNGSSTIAPATISFLGGSVNSITAIPEPSSYAVLGVLGLTIGGYRRLRRRS